MNRTAANNKSAAVNRLLTISPKRRFYPFVARSFDYGEYASAQDQKLTRKSAVLYSAPPIDGRKIAVSAIRLAEVQEN
jgi:hypothetical protein